MSKRLLTLAAVAGLAVGGIRVANATNVLFNGNLDQTGFTSQNNPCPIGWVVDASKSVSGAFFDGGDSETFCNVADPGGYGFFFKPFQGSVGPPADLLTVHLYQDNSATPGTKFTLSAYASCEANYSGLFTTNSPKPATVFFVEFLDSANSVLASNAFDLVANGLPTAGPGSMAQLTTPQYTAPSGTVTVRAGAAMFNTYGTSGGQSFFVDVFDLEAEAAPGAPVITNQPAQTTVSLGGTASFTVGVSNTAGVSYQWQLYNTNLSNTGEFSGVDTKTLTVTGVSASDVGHYRVLVSNTAGSVFSADATLAIMGVGFYPVISITGKIGDTYRVDYSTKVDPTTWIPLSTNKLVTSPQLIIDTSSPGNNSRFYRAVFLY